MPVAPRVSTPLQPVWNESEIRAHIDFLNGSAARGRTDGTVGYNVAAEYIARRLAEYGLQPASGRDFRVMHTVSRNVVTGSRLRLAGTDSASFEAGTDYLPDPRSSALQGLYGEIALGPKDTGDRGAVLLPAHAAPYDIIAARDAGAALVLIEQSPQPAFASRPISGVGILQTTSSTVSRIIAGANRGEATPERLRLRRAIRVEIAADFDPLASGVSVIGYLPGKHPTLAREAVLVCTHLDAIGNFAGVDYLDLDNFGVEVAALLEVARQFSTFSTVTRIPERTLIVGFLSGGTLRSEGLSALLRRPVWETSRIHSMYYVGAPLHGEKEVMQVASEAGLQAAFVTSRDTIPPVVVRRDQAAKASSLWSVRHYNSRVYAPVASAAARDLARRVYLVTGADLMDEVPTEKPVSREAGRTVQRSPTLP